MAKIFHRLYLERMNSFFISNRIRVFEIVAVVLTAIGKFVFMDYLHRRFVFIVVIIICWSAYVLYRNRTKPGILNYWGFRTDNFYSVTKKVLPFGLLAVVACFAIGYYQHTLNISWRIIPILILYPIWGTIQQFLLIALTAGNLQDLKGRQMNKWTIIIIAALIFGLIHYPYGWLMIGSFTLAVFYGYIYLTERNLYVLGLFHGWLGALFYYTVVGRDAYIEIFGKL